MFEGFLQIALSLVILALIAPFLGSYMARVFLGERTWLEPIALPVEKAIYSLSGLRSLESMTGWQYSRAVLYSNLVMGILVYLIFMFQGVLPLNPTELVAPSWDLALHTTISFLTNTDQQHYSGETTLSYFSQVLALGFLTMTSAATGLAVGIAFIRGLTGRPLGNFYVDLTLSITRILLPISIVGAIALLIAGVPETLAGPAVATTLEGNTQYIARGPVAHFEMIKQLGENGGGFFGINSAHPLENPNGFSNLIETLGMVIIPAGFIHTYGIIAGNRKQAWLLFWMVFIIYTLSIVIAAIAEYQGNPLINSILGGIQPNMEGKEVRFGWAATALWNSTLGNYNHRDDVRCSEWNARFTHASRRIFNPCQPVFAGYLGRTRNWNSISFHFPDSDGISHRLDGGTHPRIFRAQNREARDRLVQCYFARPSHCHLNSWGNYPGFSRYAFWHQ
jgi:K+-transporting ATPase ATPase A chain